MKRWNEKEPNTSYSCIEQYGDKYQSMLVVTNGMSWAVDPGTVETHDSFEAAAIACGLKPEDFEEVEVL